MAATVSTPPARPAADRVGPDRTPGLFEYAPEVPVALAALGFAPLDPDSVVSHLGRNDSWAGRTTDGTGVFIKRLDGQAPDGADRYDRSCAFESARAGAGALSWESPALLGGDRKRLVLVFDLLVDAVTGNTLADDGGFDTELARRAGRALAELHGFRAADVRPKPRSGTSTGRRLAALTVAEYAASSGAELALWGLLQQDRRLHGALRELNARSAAADHRPVHGDLRLDQFLLCDGTLQLTDWEEFQLADPAIDLGGFVGQWLYRTASRMFTGVDTDEVATDPDPDPGLTDADGGHPADAHGTLMRSGERELAAVLPVISAFWQGYRQHADRLDPELAERVVGYAGWHLFDRTMATASVQPTLSAVQRGIAGVGRGALLAPDRFIEAIGLVAS
ncbi:class V lanthionine synthetase subunit LxmK [Kitasatospora sp. SUK 42]|uniref:class V lanthionine synthetase subunit LxmK n=1 Tax=Kitasatospora sp. SUK 42 TaxID=1588882 RepID=UPI0018CABB51|nr:class V lanthionine synthetase subunit LxmK [Kitasatospora sp. SUK 42]MBV2155829.1 class IV lanthionine synthetase subunit LxmK [Kitasatospora sp. SUK 42]